MNEARKDARLGFALNKVRKGARPSTDIAIRQKARIAGGDTNKHGAAGF